MSFQFKKYRGSTLGEALQEVHRELGEDALILSTRSLDERAFLGLRRKPVVEITAGVRSASTEKRPGLRPALRKPNGGGSTKLIKRLYKKVSPPADEDVKDPPDGASALELETEICEVRGMVQDLVRQARYRNLADLPEQILSLYSTLIELEIPPEEVHRQVLQMATELTPEQLSERDLMKELADRFRDLFDVTGEFELPALEGHPYTIAFFGPAGAGKTSAMVKLGGQLLLRQRKIALVSVDPYRMEGLEQVQQYAHVFGVPFRGAMTPDELKEMLREMDDVEVALIDTAGHSQRNHTRMEELRILLDMIEPDERHLVIPATLSQRTMRGVLERYRRIGYDRLVVTKLDEAVHCGSLVNLALSTDKPFSYLSAGQEIPDDLLAASDALLAKLTLSNSDGCRAGAN